MQRSEQVRLRDLLVNLSKRTEGDPLELISRVMADLFAEKEDRDRERSVLEPQARKRIPPGVVGLPAVRPG